MEEGRPELVSQLAYLRKKDTGLSGKAQFRVEQHDTWLPDDLLIADVPSRVVRGHVMAALEEFYEENIDNGRIS